MNPERSGPWVGVVGLVVMLWLVISTVLYAPWWGVALHAVVLACFVPMLRRWIHDRPALAPVVPVLALLAWGVVNAVGVLALGWQVD
ncbi:hypothetical protein [Aeromicrobium sp. CTD01-1L150]|uniref:hypothetical protein n=1 Tax=Aeromicrobium sp. CTD01-1L150 TaxID=3341830 RepID=UPI0035C10BF2